MEIDGSGIMDWLALPETVQMTEMTTQERTLSPNEVRAPAYNQPKHDGQNDSDDSDSPSSPYRYLKHWYLVDTATEPALLEGSRVFAREQMQGKRLPLPTEEFFFNSSVYNNCVLRGWLQPVNPNHWHQVFVEIPSPFMVSMDRSAEYRGYWITSRFPPHTNDIKATATTDAFYWLQEPCDRTDTVDGKSQQDMHLQARVLLGLVGNVMDALFHDHPPGTAARFAQMTVQEAYDASCFAPDSGSGSSNSLSSSVDGDAAARSTGAFDLDLLRHYAHSAWLHLVGDQPPYPSCSSKFIQDLKALGSMKRVDLYTLAELRSLAETAETRSNMFPWGGSTKLIRPAQCFRTGEEIVGVGYGRDPSKTETARTDSAAQQSEGGSRESSVRSERSHNQGISPCRRYLPGSPVTDSSDSDEEGTIPAAHANFARRNG